jgi:hypothetical protein
MRTVRDAALDELRRLGGITLFANPGSTEIPLLTELPDDLHFVLALHEGSVVGLATGHAFGSGRPAVGAPLFRQYPYEVGTFVEAGVRLAVVTEDPDEANRSPVDLAVLAQHP